MASVATNNILQTFFSETLQLIQARNQDFVCVCVGGGGELGGAYLKNRHQIISVGMIRHVSS